jgi:HD-GYP domain-containing protein (c-di-GMP phosphodiesterase class II)
MNHISTYSAAGQFLSDLPFESKLLDLHHKIHDRLGYDSVGRVAVATFDEESGLLAVHAFSDLLGKPLRMYSTPLASVPSLDELAKSGRIRVINDLMALRSTPGPHTIAMRQNYRSSLTIPIRKGAAFYGFIFFNSCEVDFFSEEVVDRILPYGQLLAAITVADLDRVNNLIAAVRTTRDISKLRDDETAGHLLRMAAYARLIAVKLAPRFNLTERWIDMMTHFAPLHDVGKIGVPDKVLLKPGKLSAEEIATMRTHVEIGVHITKTLLSNFKIDDQMFGALLLNIVACHHEMLDGTGYPAGLAGDEIPLEARIVSVADIFDALTSVRPYKRAWSVDDALQELQSMAGKKIDGACVEALIGSREAIAGIMEQHRNGHNCANFAAA